MAASGTRNMKVLSTGLGRTFTNTAAVFSVKRSMSGKTHYKPCPENAIGEKLVGEVERAQAAADAAHAAVLAKEAAERAQFEKTRNPFPDAPILSERVNHCSFNYGLTNLPNSAKLARGLEDSWVAQPNLLVLADGAGDWGGEDGVDSGLYAQRLLHDFKAHFDNYPTAEPSCILDESGKQNLFVGSSTFLSATFDPTRPNIMKTLSLGDTGYMILRAIEEKDNQFEKVFRSTEQNRAFNTEWMKESMAKEREYNTPYQMGYGHVDE